MKSKKGQVTYLAELKKYEQINCAMHWGFVALILILGYSLFSTLLNWISIFAVIGMFFALKDTLVCYVKLPFKPMSDKEAKNLAKFEEHLTVLYNPLLAVRDKVLGIEAIVISGTTVLTLITNPTTNPKFTERFLTALLTKRKIEKLNVKVFNDRKAFMDRVEGLYNMASITKAPIGAEEKKIRSAILRYFL